MKQSWFVYMIRCRDGSLYTGVTTDMARRFAQHKGELSGGAKFFRSRPAVEVVWRTLTDSKAEALRLERRIKAMSREKKLALAAECSDASYLLES
jgi:putative endonuclease